VEIIQVTLSNLRVTEFRAGSTEHPFAARRSRLARLSDAITDQLNV
jgi:hypothetical protein